MILQCGSIINSIWAESSEKVHLEPVDSEGSDQTAWMHSDQGLRSPQAESFDFIKCINGEQMPG